MQLLPAPSLLLKVLLQNRPDKIQILGGQSVALPQPSPPQIYLLIKLYNRDFELYSA
jgi:hypothetical protein